MQKIKAQIRKITPNFILDLIGRFKFVRNTDLFSKRPLYSILKLTYWMPFVWTNKDILFTTPDGTKFLSMPLNLSSFIVSFNNYRDLAIQKFLIKTLKSKYIFVDAGANIGTYTIRAAQIIKEGSVFAYEAHPLTYKYLSKNIIINNFNNVKTFNVAFGSQMGEIDMSFNSKNAGETHVATGSEHNVKVPLQTLDFSLENENINEINYLKIDVEGFELPLLKGAEGIIKKSPNIIIQTELNDTHAKRYGNSVKNLVDLLVGWGFVPHSVDSSGKTLVINVSGPIADTDVLWWRESSVI